MKPIETTLPGVMLLYPPRFDDARGTFRPIFATRLHELASHSWAEMNMSVTARGVIRGLHFQHPRGQAKLITVISGTIFDVVVDLRPGPSFLKHITVTLSADDPSHPSQIYIPEGLAHGLATPHESATITYLVSQPWSPEDEHVIAYNDPTLAIAWPLPNPILSDRDRLGELIENFTNLQSPVFSLATLKKKIGASDKHH